MKTNRKAFLKQAAAAGSTMALSSLGFTSLSSRQKSSNDRISNPIGISTYSYWQFDDNREDAKIEDCIEKASRTGFDGVEILLVQLQELGSTDNAYLQKLKRQALHSGIDLMGLSTHQQFLSVTKEERKKEVEKTKKQIEIAYSLGIPTIRIQTGTWGTSGSFDELMANKGIEEPVEGYTKEDAFKWVIDGIQQCIPKAEECGVTLGLENHWGLGRTAEGMVRIFNAVDSPWLQFTADTGNFLDHKYEQLEAVAENTVLIQAKTYFGGGLWYDNRANFDRVAQIFHDVGYKGYVSLEFEGKGDPNIWIPKV